MKVKPSYLLTMVLIALSTAKSANAQGGLEGDSWLLGVLLGLGTGVVGFVVFWFKKKNAGKQKEKQTKYLDPVKLFMGLIIAVAIGCQC